MFCSSYMKFPTWLGNRLHIRYSKKPQQQFTKNISKNVYSKNDYLLTEKACCFFNHFLFCGRGRSVINILCNE